MNPNQACKYALSQACRCALTVLLFTALSLHAEDAAARAARAGELKVIKNQRVLFLRGDDVKERGFAHGYFLADQIRDDIDSALISLPNFSPQKFETRMLPWANSKFDWDTDASAELDGVFDGMAARLGESGIQSASLKRPFTRKDLAAINVLADYFGPACSGFTVWDNRSVDGKVLHGRNLDFPIGPKPIADQVLFINEAIPKSASSPARMRWIGLGWPGLIVQFSGMNNAGLTACIHDGYNTDRAASVPKGDYAPRGMVLRRILETVDPADSDPAEAAAKIAGEKLSACGNLFHLSWPAAAAQKNNTTPAAVLEFEPSSTKVVIRRMDDSGALVVTNHFRLLNKSAECARYKAISDGLELLAKADRKVGLPEARKLLMSAEQPVAAHSVYFFPDTLEFSIALTKDNVMAPHVAPVAFSFAELFAK
jgi:hypothetical protein